MDSIGGLAIDQASQKLKDGRWTYLTTPFFMTIPGFEVTEGTDAFGLDEEEGYDSQQDEGRPSSPECEKEEK